MTRKLVKNSFAAAIALALLGMSSCVPLVLGGAAAYAIGDDPPPRSGMYEE